MGASIGVLICMVWILVGRPLERLLPRPGSARAGRYSSEGREKIDTALLMITAGALGAVVEMSAAVVVGLWRRGAHTH